MISATSAKKQSQYSQPGQKTQSHIEQAGWQETDVPAELPPVPFLNWLIKAHQNGTEYLAVDPDHGKQSDMPQPVIRISDIVDDAATLVINRVQSYEPPPATGIQQTAMWHCQRCGKIIELNEEQSAPECCSEAMAIAASNTHTTPLT